MTAQLCVNDYRFLPEPNLPPLNLSSVDIDALRESIPEMPDITRNSLSDYNLQQQEIEIMVKYPNLLHLFLNTVQHSSDNNVVNIATKLLKYNILGACKQLKIHPQQCPLTVENLVGIIDMINEGIINLTIANDIILEVVKNPTTSARNFVEENNWKIITDPSELHQICKFVVEKYDKVTRKARRGKEGEFEKLVKAVLKESNNRADIALSKPILQNLLETK